ncbi:hypothetical protein L6164_024098 [Bauhinia variegata]|uniref:Uncharacterized protein n=1 Tax=Bauhinia variegata TaxID=167791 RepID=A0ACB9LXV7_BAUVA|nr:hypothetical protein L6164_024098 [Bauhinia variegata]
MSKIPLTLSLHFFLFLCVSVPWQVNSQPTSTEQEILLEIKQQLGDPPSIGSWNASSSPCHWPEINCTEGTVTAIQLSGKNINRVLPATICDLKNLAYLDVSNNDIPGEFPTSLYNCSNLQILYLSQNYFVGPIPDDIDRLKTLRYIDLGGNNFSGDIPAAIGKLTELQRLLLYRNEFNGTFPKEIGDLSNLEILGMAYNRKFVPMAIPPEFGKLKKLRTIWMTWCNLIGEIPQSFSNLTNLELMDLSANNLTGNIPSSLFSLRNLTSLFLYQNKLSGELPTSIQALNLTQIDLAMNNLTGMIPQEFGNLKNLVVLHLYYNELSGPIPTDLGQIQTLHTFRVFNNKLNGTLPADFGRYSKLVYFEVGNNQLSGGLPEYLCEGGSLQGLIAFSNNLIGSLPSGLGNCPSLVSLNIYNNNFSGEIPLGLWTSWNLTTLKLSGNSFSGQLPNKLAWNLSRVEINDNEFSGQLSTDFFSSLNLVVFEARNNFFSGEIPRELTNVSRLNSLVLDGNQLSGELPTVMISWESLNTLTLSRNKLSGQIPLAIIRLSNLVYLDLSENDISGEIPPQLGNLRLVFLNLSSNRLSGRIPDEFNNLAYENSFLNNPNLCANNPNLKLQSCLTKPPHSKKSSSKYIYFVFVLLIVVMVATVSLICYKFRGSFSRKPCKRDLSTWRLTSFQRLDLSEMNLFSNLTDNNLIGSGGAGRVYRVASNHPGEYVAVKRIWNCEKLDQKLEKEFMAEVEILGSIRHSNIVKLLCCFSSENCKLLVYEYMENQSLDRWLRGTNRKSATGLSSRNNGFILNWPKRLKIAIGAAQGLCYMHHDCSPPIIHRDVKSSNILLDCEFRASIADFGLAKILAKHGEPNTMSVIAGSFGYIAPEYAYSMKVNEKVDVYSFGVVLLELITGKLPNNGDEQISLADWAWRHYSEGKPFADALDEEIKEACHLEAMITVFKLGLICTSTSPSTRPSMKEILQGLRQCCPQESYGEKKRRTEFDFTPLLSDATYISSYKDSNRAMNENDVSSLYSV